jgi:hypothetical protein
VIDGLKYSRFRRATAPRARERFVPLLVQAGADLDLVVEHVDRASRPVALAPGLRMPATAREPEAV